MKLRLGRGRQKEGEEETTKPRPHTAFIACAMKYHTPMKPGNIARATPMVM